MPARLCALAAVIAACGPRQVAHPAPPLPDVLERAVAAEVAAYRDAALFPDERALAEDPACRIDVAAGGGALLTDEQARTACDALAAKRRDDRANACRRACLVDARVSIAPRLQRDVVAGVHDFRARLADDDHDTCRALVKHSQNQVREDQARALWSCLGLVPLPARADLTIQFRTHEHTEGGTTSVDHDGHVSLLSVTISMIPGGIPRQLIVSDGGGTCPLDVDGVCVATEQP